jgi:D-glycero-D-manno-heptose 1,7-bisphosphate phosphatase
MKDACIFLDRDGTINEEVDFLSSPQNLHLLPRAAEAIREFNTLGFKIFIVTNQSGIARGLLTEKQLHEIHLTLIEKLSEHGVRIDAIYYCPHHPDFGEPQYHRECDCRKPRTGMITKAIQGFSADLSHSFVIGDRLIDIQMGNAVGIPSILVMTGYGKQELLLCQEHHADIVYIAADLFDAAQFVKRSVHQQQLSPL